jgi:hypothetical protein
VSVVKQRDGEEEWQRLELGMSAEESERRLGIEGEWCGVLWGWCLPFYRGWGSIGEAATVEVMAFKPLMVGEGLRGGLNVGFTGGVND